MSERVRLDLNFPEFQAQLFSLDINEIKQVFKTFKKLSSLTWMEVYRDWLEMGRDQDLQGKLHDPP
jgi:hypothetical protein